MLRSASRRSLSPNGSEDAMDRIDLKAKFFRGFGDPIRVAILEAVADRELSVEEICHEVGCKQPRISNHLACLRWCQFVQARRDGNRVYYSIIDPLVRQILSLADTALDERAERVEACARV